MAGCVSRGRLSSAACGPVHSPVQTEDRRRPGDRTMTRSLRIAAPTVLVLSMLIVTPAAVVRAAQQPADTPQLEAESAKQPKGKYELPHDTRDEIRHALIRLPLAALLGAALALRPKRRGTPPRQPAVIQTQIILAIVGAVVMLVVGTNLARAFGVVGAAGL